MVTVSKPYNQGVSPALLNRLLLILGFVGLFISGVLSMEHMYQIQIPCTNGGGCEAVARHSSSYFMGEPVAYYGFVGYCLLTIFALARTVTGQLTNRFLVGFGYLGSAIGVVASLYLQYTSFFVIGATCVWCLSSAITMIATFVLYTMLYNKMQSEEATPFAFVPKELILGVVGVSIALGGVFGIIYGRTKVVGPVEIVDDAKVAQSLVPEPKSSRNQLGPDDAPVTVVEFADLCCPTCRAGFSKTHELVAKYPGKLRVIYRHFPLFRVEGHQMATVAAVTAEVAAGKGKFWDFATAFTAPEEAPKDREGVDKIAQSVGIDPADITKALDDPNSPAQKRLVRDYTDALKVFNVQGTPTYIVSAKGQPAKKLTLTGVMAELDSKEFQALLKP